MIAIAAVDKNWAIGNKGDLLVSLPEDQKDNFRKETLGNTVVLGRKTLSTFPGQKVLPRRKNIVLTRDNLYRKDGAIILHSTQELLDYNKEHPNEKIFLIGGEKVYNEFLPFCDYAIITHVMHEFEADAFFPDLTKDKHWSKICDTPVVDSVKGFSFYISHYRKIS